jgi:hypothetical protein
VLDDDWVIDADGKSFTLEPHLWIRMPNDPDGVVAIIGRDADFLAT